MSRHEVQRMCCFCRIRKPKQQLLRIVKTEQGIEACFEKNVFGRSAYVCPERACIDGMIRRKALDRSFRIHIPDSVYERLSKELETLG